MTCWAHCRRALLCAHGTFSPSLPEYAGTQKMTRLADAFAGFGFPSTAAVPCGQQSSTTRVLRPAQRVGHHIERERDDKQADDPGGVFAQSLHAPVRGEGFGLEGE